MSNYELNVISHHQDFNGKSLRKYYVNGIDTVGAYGNEPFSIVFKNNTWQKVQVVISVDGTDVFTGKRASTEPNNKMWVVNPCSKLELSAWCENDFGGASFVFTSADNSVAIHTHGDLSSRGIIAAAVFVEGHVEPQRLDRHYHYHYDYTWPNFWINYPYTTIGTLSSQYTGSITSPTWTIYNNTNTTGVVSQNNAINLGNIGHNSATFDSCEVGEAMPAASEMSGTRARQSLESLVAVGAGQHVDQKISYVQGLIKPVFTETVRVKYVWWDTLVEMLRQNNVPTAHPSGFPADGDKHHHINLCSTPRLPKHGSFTRSVQPVYQRV